MTHYRRYDLHGLSKTMEVFRIADNTTKIRNMYRVIRNVGIYKMLSV